METTGWGDMSMLRTLGEGLNDAKQNRVRTVNRVERGNIADALYGPEMIKRAKEEEGRYNDWLVEEYARVVPEHVRRWAAEIPGLRTGELFPRIIASIGNPRVATPETWGEVAGKKTVVPDGEPYERGVRQLWSYCGCGDPDRRPTKGMSREELLACGKRTVTRPLLYTWTSGIVRATGRSTLVKESRHYLLLQRTKQEAQGNVHARECRNHARPPMKSNGCGTVAHPEWGEIGSGWRPSHIDMHAHRVVQKEFLKELWNVSGG